MKRHCHNPNCNRTLFNDFNHIRSNKSTNNPVTPEILVNQIWMQEEDTSGVKIIELNSSSGSSKESPVNWSYVNNNRFEEVEYDRYRVNEDARRRRRINMNHDENVNTAYANRYNYDREMQSHNSFYTSDYSDNNSAPRNHQMNCFTIINNQHVNSDSSTDNENYEAMEIIEIDTAEENNFWDHVYDDEAITYNTNTQPEKRTIWIYSYKNKRLLTDNDFELVNIPSKDNSSTSTSCSISDEDQKADKETTARRIGSPIPATFIPRLDLSLVQTLSTVTELSEPNKSRSKESSHETINVKPRNNWLTDRNDNIKEVDNSNVVNWMALSPRERRLRSINTHSDITEKENVTETEVTYAEGNEQFNKVHTKSIEIETSTMQVQVDIHTNEKETGTEVSTRTNDESELVKLKKIADIYPMEISFADTDKDIDNNYTELDYSNRPSIQISTKLNKTEITDPIEKLDCNNWITEDKVETKAAVYDYDIENVGEIDVTASSSENVAVDSASKRVWLKNLQLMKPPLWAEYLPITCSPPSLHLSLSQSTISSRKSWFKCLTKCIKCCK